MSQYRGWTRKFCSKVWKRQQNFLSHSLTRTYLIEISATDSKYFSIRTHPLRPGRRVQGLADGIMNPEKSLQSPCSPDSNTSKVSRKRYWLYGNGSLVCSKITRRRPLSCCHFSSWIKERSCTNMGTWFRGLAIRSDNCLLSLCYGLCLTFKLRLVFTLMFQARFLIGRERHRLSINLKAIQSILFLFRFLVTNSYRRNSREISWKCLLWW